MKKQPSKSSTFDPSIPPGTTHIHIGLKSSYELDGYCDPRMYEKWVPVSYKLTSNMVYHWSGSEWVYYLTASKSDRFIKNLRAPIKKR